MEETIGLNSDIIYEGPEYENRGEEGDPLIDLDQIAGPTKLSWKRRRDKFKRDLAEIFDDDLGTKKWKNIADYIIIGMILLSSIEIFLSTFNLDPKFRIALRWIESFTLIFFTIEVTLRIWVAPLINPKFAGWKGRIKYCLTFNGFIDVISTYPFYLEWLIPFPIIWMKAFRMSRVVRLFRLSRYMKSWDLLTGAIREKKHELLISMQFLLIITFILSLVLYFCEHEVQPDVYNNGFSSVMWAMAQYIGDPGKFGETPPITGMGKGIACMVGLLGIAIVAVPAGIVGSGFAEAIEKYKFKDYRKDLRNVFERTKDTRSGYYALNFFRSIVNIQTRTGMTQPQIIETVKCTPGFRLINVGDTYPISRNEQDRLAVEHFVQNRSYGACIDRGSPITIISPTSVLHPAIGMFSYYVALIGGFNFISRETGKIAPYHSFELIECDLEENQEEYIHDLRNLADRPGAWNITMLAFTTDKEDGHDHSGEDASEDSIQLISRHFIHPRGYADFEAFFYALQKSMETFDVNIGNGDDYTFPENFWIDNIGFKTDASNIVVRLSWDAFLRNLERLNIARELANQLNITLIDNPGNPFVPALYKAGIGFNGYDDLWMNDAKNMYVDALETHAHHDTRELTYSAVVIIQRDLKDKLKYIIGKYDIEPCVLTKPEWASDAWLKGTFAHKLKSAVQESEYGAPTSNKSLRNGVVIAIGDKVKHEVLIRLGYTRIPNSDALKEGSGSVFSEIYQTDGDLPLVLWTDGKIQFSLKKISMHTSQLIKTVTNTMANPLKGGKKILDASRHILIKNKNI